MVRNSECLQLIELDDPLLCRKNPNYYPRSVCPLNRCEAREVLEDPEKLKRVVGSAVVDLFGANDNLIRQSVFHRICPGEENPQGGYDDYLRIEASR